jgi:hypothetical protein
MFFHDFYLLPFQQYRRTKRFDVKLKVSKILFIKCINDGNQFFLIF